MEKCISDFCDWNSCATLPEQLESAGPIILAQPLLIIKSWYQVTAFQLISLLLHEKIIYCTSCTYVLKLPCHHTVADPPMGLQQQFFQFLPQGFTSIMFKPCLVSKILFIIIIQCIKTTLQVSLWKSSRIQSEFFVLLLFIIVICSEY